MRSYSIDPARISLKEFRKLTTEKKMQPGRRMLREQMDEPFAALKEAGIENLADLIGLLSTKAKIRSFSGQTGLSTDYLVVLKREASSYISKAYPLSDFHGIPFEYIELLKSRGIKNTKDLFEKGQSEPQQAQLSHSCGIPVYRIEELFSLCDLSRITGVGGIFARILYEAGIRSPEDFAGSDPSALLRDCRSVIRKYGYSAGNPGMKDVLYAKTYAGVLVNYDT